MSTKKSSISSSKGFTLVELLIVVAIIGVLASQGVPAYRRMIQKSRKGEAQVALGAIATAQSSFFGEYGRFTNNLARAGAQSDGQQFVYAVGFSDAACTQVAAGAILPTIVTVPNLPANWSTTLPGPLGGATTSMVGKVVGYDAAPRTLCSTGALGTFPVVGLGVSEATYVASATGNIAIPTSTVCPGGVTTCDIWYIDNNRRLNNVNDGIQ